MICIIPRTKIDILGLATSEIVDYPQGCIPIPREVADASLKDRAPLPVGFPRSPAARTRPWRFT